MARILSSRDKIRNELIVVFGEFCGTFMFLLMAFIGTQAAIENNSPGNPDAPLFPFSLMYIAASFGTAVAVNVWVFYRITGGMFNPAVTLGLVLVGAVSPLRGILIFPTQLVAGIAAAAVTDALLPGPLLVANKLSSGTSISRGLFIEMFLTAQLVITVYFLAVEKHRATFLAPLGIGLAVFIAHICGTNYTGTSINPARSFGPAVVTDFTGYQWIYWLGPFLGSFLAFVVYTILKWMEYHTANPGQDDDENKVKKSPAGLALPTNDRQYGNGSENAKNHSPSGPRDSGIAHTTSGPRGFAAV
ncbi:aquaporin-like protein [Trichoderma citrinoviride]|uniref:Aquaporin-like protein n=1 Tax=Trichoderma citrinoviride TaxID=58853 RepID=A0A2T4B2T6_9HYPO|nr:aquaporin-like protein [Trichoderma citrinoviride]PTB63624.1 aquaporin-like protein [Trichoderma citrinoviride]